MVFKQRLLLFVPMVLFAAFANDADAFDPPSEKYDFNRDIRPILSGRCFACHGPDGAARQAELRLDRSVEALESGTIIAGNPDQSELIKRITSHDPDFRMPPKGKALSASDISKLTAWIADGATYETHWSFSPPVKSGRPEVRQSAWPTGEIDYFILNKLERSAVKPSPKASPAILLRRLYLDLIGLPPSVEDVKTFEADPSTARFAAKVDQLLASERFGEKWAAGWLDLARYADSNGYQHDDMRTMWPYRDWVINALNDDMPFDRFTIEQLAGDLLPDPTEQQLVATGFNRNVPVNFSGGTKVEEIRANVLHDRVATTGTVWLGLTLGCAQCHDHKFDAISQEEYYQLYAYFNKAVPEVAQKSETMFKKLFVGRELIVYQSPADRIKAKRLISELAMIDKPIAAPEEVNNRQLILLDFEGPEPLATNNLSHPGTTSTVDDVPDGGGKTAAKTVIKPSENDPGFFGSGYSFDKRDLSRMTSISFWIKTSIQSSFNFQVHSSDKSVSVFGFSTANIKPDTWTKITAKLDGFTKPPWAMQEVDWSAVTKIQVTAYGNGPYGGNSIILDNVIGQQITEVDERKKRLAELRKELDALQTSTMVMQDAEVPTSTHIMIRGDYTTPGKPVEPGVLSALHPIDNFSEPNRLGLARWLTSADNPLTARVAVNRIWAEIFGKGLVSTPGDFGMRGSAPSHPRLLDWLAVDFVEQGWSIKRLIRTLVLSSTYQQTSIANEALQQSDPSNELYARGPRFRLTAELIRDNLLAASGLLSNEMGGPVVYPLQPDGLWKEILSVMDVTEYPTSTGSDRHRRGIYTVWRRGNPYPSMINFDAPERAVCTTQRDRSNTPLQALTLLNDPVYVEMATHFATRIWRWDGNDREKVIRAFRTVVSRKPSEDEVEVLLELRRKRGSWYSVAQVLLNLDEAITKS